MQENTQKSIIKVDRAIHELRMGRMVIIGNYGYTPAEYALNTEPAYNNLSNLRLLITKERAKFLGIADDATLLEIGGYQALAKYEWLFNPNIPRDLNDDMPKPLPHDNPTYMGTHVDALELIKIAELLPALLVVDVADIKDESEILSLQPGQVQDYKNIAPASLEITVSATIPQPGGPAQLTLFRALDGKEHMAITVGDYNDSKNAPLLRVHSSCLTGDVLESLRCDCGEQLRDSFQQMREHGSGVMIYVNQEGRGIGLANKLRCYQLQDGGMDTFTANQAIGFADDERAFDIAGTMIKKLKLQAFYLLTNNPNKINALKAMGFNVIGNKPLIAKSNSVNHAYLQAKKEKAGHIL
jgi:GTP cyclohydrolase II